MIRSQLSPMPEYFDRYINMCDDVELLTALQTSLDELDHLPLAQWTALGDRVYAPGKWTVKDILQHLIDTERIFSYRALAFARQESQKVPSYDEDAYALAANARQRSLESLVQEMKASRLSLLALFQSFTPEMLARVGMGFRGEYSVHSIGFILAGHQRWHLNILEERYYPLLNEQG